MVKHALLLISCAGLLFYLSQTTRKVENYGGQVATLTRGVITVPVDIISEGQSSITVKSQITGETFRVIGRNQGFASGTLTAVVTPDGIKLQELKEIHQPLRELGTIEAIHSIGSVVYVSIGGRWIKVSGDLDSSAVGKTALGDSSRGVVKIKE